METSTKTKTVHDSLRGLTTRSVCRHCRKSTVFCKEADETVRNCINCGRERVDTVTLAAERAAEMGIISACTERAPDHRFDGVGARFAWLTGLEIDRLLSDVPLLRGEQDCGCLHVRNAPATHTGCGVCRQCGRLWVQQGTEMILAPWNARDDVMKRMRRAGRAQ